jgi:hypothetical protein
MTYPGSVRISACPRLFTTTLAILFLLPVVRLNAQRPEPTVHATYDGDPMYTVLPPNTIPAILNPTFVSGQEAEKQMSPDEPVIGVVISGDTRAYSMWHLDAHEIVNDTVGGRAIAVTW